MSSEHSQLLPGNANGNDKRRTQGLSLVSSFENLRQSFSQSLEDLTTASMNASNRDDLKKNKDDEKLGGSWKSRYAILFLLGGCIVIVAIVSFFLPIFDGRNEHLPSSGVPTTGTTTSRDTGPKPFSMLDPVHDLHLFSWKTRPEATKPPPQLFVSQTLDSPEPAHKAVPTNAWYQNLLMLGEGEQPSNLHRAYATPYILDMVGDIPGLRTLRTRTLAGDQVLQLTVNDIYGLTLGAAKNIYESDLSLKENSQELDFAYQVLETTKLAVTLQWTALKMVATIARGMPYSTMEYMERNTTSDSLLPTIHSPLHLIESPQVDGADSTKELKCDSNNGAPATTRVEREIELKFDESDFTWLVFFSEPVLIQCRSEGGTILQILSEEASERPLVVRTALVDTCTNNRNPTSCREGLGDRIVPEETKHTEDFAKIIRQFAPFYPGRRSSVSYQIDDEDNSPTLDSEQILSKTGKLIFDWDVQTMPDVESSASVSQDDSELEHTSALRKSEDAYVTSATPTLIMFGLPHHMDILSPWKKPNGIKYCRSSLNGPTCLVEGATWDMVETLPRIGLQAARLPRAEFLPALSDALQKDLNYTLPDFFERGAGDTYFSGKMISKLARIVLISEELFDICEGKTVGDSISYETEDEEMYRVACNNVTLPTPSQQTAAINRLRSSVEVWINGTAETPFVYDEAWGGVVSCGCLFNGKTCDNKFPDCPAFTDQGLNFGNGFYNDMHFHYGYHIHGAAVVAHFDPDWGKKHFEEVLLLVRSIANPAEDDTAFPLFRHKDWFQGSSWASGVPLPPYLNGKNQESSSEAIAGYESVALFGQVMQQVWTDALDEEKSNVAKEIFKAGQFLTATELRSTKKYWHIKHNNPKEAVVPSIYTGNVVGILWSTMAQFGTWFGAAPYLPYGIQLLPLTPISEERDEIEWVNEMYYPFSRACADFHQCTESGWAILQLAILATVGYPSHAADRVKELLPDSYENAGGNGQSKSNTIWYIATRPVIESPVPMDESDVRGHDEIRPAPVFFLKDCHTPESCTDEVLNRRAGLYTCRSRIDWLINSQGNSQWEACTAVGSEFNSCKACSPAAEANVPAPEEIENSEEQFKCDQCTLEQCNSDLNRCPASVRTFVCTDGPSRGGCSPSPWTLGQEQCNTCCEMTHCQRLKDEEAKKITKDGNALEPPKCPPCEKSVCYGKVNQCPLHTAPYLCLDGHSLGGCASTPWNTAPNLPANSTECNECCEITVTC